MRVGLVCPYDLGRHGGVQAQVLGLAAELAGRGHQVGVLGPGRPGNPTSSVRVTTAGRGLAVRGNGSVAHLALGPAVPGRVETWLAQERPDVVHVHEPATPGLAVTAVRRARAAGVPVVATFHASRPLGRTARASRPLVRRVLGPLAATTAVSPQARAVAREQYLLDPLLVPNGLDVAAYRPLPDDGGRGADGPTVLFLGRRDEPRKGLPVLAAALPDLRRRVPGLRVVLAGPGTATVPGARDLGAVDEATKRRLLREADVLVAPHTGRESFGIVLAEAMAAGTPVVASDLPAFRDVLGDAGLLVPPGDAAALSSAAAGLLLDAGLATRLGDRAARRVGRWDWPVLAGRWEDVYAGAAGASGAALAGS